MGFFLTEQATPQTPGNSQVSSRSFLGAKSPIGAPIWCTILSSKYWDGDTKTLAYQLRDYGPGIGKWLSRDKLQEWGGINLYTFVKNNTQNKVDRLGLNNFPPDIIIYDPANPGGPNTGYDNPDADWGDWDPDFGGKGGPPRKYEPISNYIGGEINIGDFGFGITTVGCCDENNDYNLFFYRKICVGSGRGVSVVSGFVSGMNGDKCKKERYEGYFLEFGGGFKYLTGGIDFGFETKYFHGFPIPGEPSGVSESGAGLGAGWPAKVMLCYYSSIFEPKKIKCGCGSEKKENSSWPIYY
jgi:RHS repeat-associated protein